VHGLLISSIAGIGSFVFTRWPVALTSQSTTVD
jgi:hypothetical protein